MYIYVCIYIYIYVYIYIYIFIYIYTYIYIYCASVSFSTKPKAPGKTLELNEQLILACFPGVLANSKRTRFHKNQLRVTWDQYFRPVSLQRHFSQTHVWIMLTNSRRAQPEAAGLSLGKLFPYSEAGWRVLITWAHLSNSLLHLYINTDSLP